MNRIKQKRTLIIVSVIAVLFFIIIGYAGYNSILKLNASYSVSENFEVKITDIQTKNTGGHAINNSAPTFDGTTATFDAKFYLPGDYIEYTVVLTNTGNVDTVFESVEEVEDIGSALIFSYSGIEAGDALPANSEKTITIRVEYDINVTEQPEVLSNTFDLTINFVEGKGNITVDVEEVRPQITAAEKLRKKVVETGDGLYADTYEEGRYVYKGADPDNYITFNGEEAGWRIISVEADGTIKIMRNTSIGNITWDDSGSNDWARPATLNTYLNSTYKGTIDTTYLQTHDFDIGAVTDGNTDLAAQITAEKSSTWNGDIGLMSLSDYLRANTNTAQCGNFSLNNTNYETCATTNWIAVALKSSYPWTMTPNSGSSGNVFSVYDDGYVLYSYARHNSSGVAPVLYLKSDITLTGTGSSGDPYEIEA